MNDQDSIADLRDALFILVNQMRRWEKDKQAMDKESDLSDHTSTDDWKEKASRIVKEYNDMQERLESYQKLVALRIGQRPSRWTAEEMIELLAGR